MSDPTEPEPTAAAPAPSITTSPAPLGPELQSPPADEPLPAAPLATTPPATRAERRESPAPDVAVGEGTSMPGVHRGGFTRLPTAPIDVSPSAPPTLPVLQPDVRWLMPEPEPAHRGMAGWALGFSIVGLAVSLIVGWGFPIGLVAIVSAIIALRRPLESRAVAVWAIVLGTLSLVYSVGWLLFAASRTSIFG